MVSEFETCADQITYMFKCINCNQTMIAPNKTITCLCNSSFITGKIAIRCMQDPSAFIVDPSNCARYFNCSQTITYKGFQQYQAECDYPLLFNEQTLSCDDFTVVQCGTRMEPKAPCELLGFLSLAADFHVNEALATLCHVSAHMRSSKQTNIGYHNIII